MDKEQQRNINLVKKALTYFAGNFSSKILNLIIIPIYANYLSANELGKYDYQLTIANLLMPIIALAIWEAVLRFGLNAEKSELPKIISTALIIGGSTIFMASIILFILYVGLYGLNVITCLYVILIISMPIVNLLGYITRTVQKSKVYAMSGVISSIINLVSLIIFVIYLKKGLFGLLLSTIFGNIFNFLFLLVFGGFRKYIRFSNFSRVLAKQLIRYSIPLIFNLVFGWFVSSFSRIYINQSIGSTENGIYAFASKFSGVVYQIASIINLTMIEDAILSAGSDEWIERFERNTDVITQVFFKICFLLLPIIGVYYQFITNIDFSSSLNLVPLLLISTIFINMSTLLGNIFSVYNKTSKIFVTSLIGGISNVIFSIVMGNFFGLIGIVIGQLMGSLILVITRYYLGNAIESYHLDIRKLIYHTCIFIVVSYLTLTKNLGIQLVVFVVVSLGLIYIYNNQIKKILKKINLFIRNRKG